MNIPADKAPTKITLIAARSEMVTQIFRGKPLPVHFNDSPHSDGRPIIISFPSTRKICKEVIIEMTPDAALQLAEDITKAVAFVRNTQPQTDNAHPHRATEE